MMIINREFMLASAAYISSILVHINVYKYLLINIFIICFDAFLTIHQRIALQHV